MQWPTLTSYLSIDQVMFTIMGYPMSYIEFFGTLFNLWSVVLVARNRIATWPVGIVGVILFLVLFYQIQLYADVIEQVYYLGASAYGWWWWSKRGNDSPSDQPTLRFSPSSSIARSIAVTVVLSLLLGAVVSRIHLWLPALFPEPTTYAYLDALTTIMSFTATLLMAHKRVECWWYWIAVDIIGIGLYAVKGVQFIALLYVVFLMLAINGLRSWTRASSTVALSPASPQL